MPVMNRLLVTRWTCYVLRIECSVR